MDSLRASKCGNTAVAGVGIASCDLSLVVYEIVPKPPEIPGDRNVGTNVEYVVVFVIIQGRYENALTVLELI